MSANKETKETKKEVQKTPEVQETPPKKETYHAIRSALQEADFARKVHRYEPKAGIPFKEVIKPGFWLHVASDYRRGDVIEVFPEDGEYFAELLVVNAGKLHLSIWVKSFELINKAEKGDDSKFFVEWKGIGIKWCVIMRNTGKEDFIIYKNAIDKDEAYDELAKYKAAL